MKKWLKRIRGAVGMGLTWAAVWAGVGALIPLFSGLFSVGGFAVLLFGVFVMVATYGMLGFVGGAVFSVVLGITERRRRFDQMSLPRFAAWGAGAGLILAVLTVAMGIAMGGAITPGNWIFMGTMPLLAAGSAAGSLALARRADDRELLEHGADVADIGLTEEETQQLLGGTR